MHAAWYIFLWITDQNFKVDGFTDISLSYDWSDMEASENTE